MTAELDTSSLPRLPARDGAGHKGTFGTVAVIGGSCGGGTMMLGAPVLSARGALRSGAGLVKLVMPEPLLTSGLSMLPSATGIVLPVDGGGEIVAHEAAGVVDRVLKQASCVVVGPGLGADQGLSRGVEATVLRVLQQDAVPVVVDADALNAMGRVPELWRDFHAPAILTPHPGEFRRLADSLGLTLDAIDKATRPSAAAELAQRLGCVVVLKGAGTIVSDGLRVWRCERGHACLGTAGTGDVLSGILGGLIAQHYNHAQSAMRAKLGSRMPAGAPPLLSLYDLARIAVEVHARCGEAWAAANGQAGLLAPELTDLVPGQIARLGEPRA